MRILYLTHQYFPRHVGGTEVYTHGLARRAVAAGFTVQVVTYHESPSGHRADFGVAHEEYEGIPVCEIHYNLSVAPNPARAEYDNAFTAEMLSRELSSFRPDLVHVMHAMKLSGSALRVCHSLGIPIVVTLCDFWFICPRHTLLKWDGSLCEGPEHRLTCVKCLHHTHGVASHELVALPDADMLREIRRRRIGREKEPTAFWRDIHAIRRRHRYLIRVLLKARRIIALSAFQKQMFVKNGVPEERIEVIRHGLELDGVRPVSRTPGAVPKIVYIGSLVTHKGPHVVLEALGRIPNARLEFRLYGALHSTAYEKGLKKLAGSDSRIRFMGTFKPSEFGRVMAEADVLVVPALWYENEPLVVKAALHVGTPVLASRIGSLSEMVEPGKNGWLLEPGHVGAWAEALEKIAMDPLALPAAPTRVKSMDENAREMFEIYAQEIGR